MSRVDVKRTSRSVVYADTAYVALVRSCRMDQSSLESRHFIGGEEVSLPGKGRGTGWEDHPEEDDEALGELPKEGIETLLVEVRGAKPVGRLAARLAEIAGGLGLCLGDIGFSFQGIALRICPERLTIFYRFTRFCAFATVSAGLQGDADDASELRHGRKLRHLALG